jgi:5-methylcytosine-specific restriction endonuclease McrA
MATDITACELIEPREGACWVKGCEAPLPKRARRWCSADHRQLWGRNHIWSKVRRAALRRGGGRCSMCRAFRFDEYMEVDHIEPLGDGSHATSQCRHHLDNVRTLCRPCHVRRTTQHNRAKRSPAQEALL